MFRMTTVIWSLTRWSMQKMILMSMIMVRRMRKNKEKRKNGEERTIVEDQSGWNNDKMEQLEIQMSQISSCQFTERERDVYDKFGYTYQNREQNNKYIGIHPRLKAKIKGVFVLQFNDKTILCCIIWQGFTLLTQS
ncbi:uncharacterized protein LOC130946404 [Arachis stenosperma]|uniref:uncharacterized protein LOC130946404 n=1 Tax=Arachis stenosperma TaxID=217475 RepID=UPI0025AB6C97|nr:uncharacterized protein LOC130946404 [Arachis stenosperma]